MGILNITPDSFSDPGLFFDPDRAAAHAQNMVRDGADIIDVGGESTRPGSEAVPVNEEVRRVVPVIRSLRARVSVPISVDTYKAEVARKAIDAGASIVNDISGFRFDPEMASLVAEVGVPVVLMHIKGTPKNMQVNPAYDDLIGEIREHLAGSIEIARNAGVRDDRIIIDPGIGFGKTIGHNLEIIRRLCEFRSLNKPILIGPSRKAFIGRILGDLPVTERLEGTAAAVAISIFNGAHIVRVHDVKEMSRVAKMTDAIIRGWNQTM
jgi:dihydropteroate synthase